MKDSGPRPSHNFEYGDPTDDPRTWAHPSSRFPRRALLSNGQTLRGCQCGRSLPRMDTLVREHSVLERPTWITSSAATSAMLLVGEVPAPSKFSLFVGVETAESNPRAHTVPGESSRPLSRERPCAFSPPPIRGGACEYGRNDPSGEGQGGCA